MIVANTSEPIWKTLGISSNSCIERIQSVEASLKWWGRYIDVFGPSSPENPTAESYDGRREDLFTCYEQIQLAHLNIEHSFGESCQIIETASELGVDLFCGSWWDQALLHSGQVLNRQQAREEYDQWIDSYRIAFLFAFLNRNRTHAKQIAQFIGDDLFPDDGSWDRTENDRLFYWLISEYVGGNKAPKSAAETINKGRLKRPKLLLAQLEAIQQGDSAAFEKSLKELIKGFRNNEIKIPKRDINKVRIVTSIDASLMWNLAEMNGLEITMPNKECALHVITRDSVGYM